MSEHTLNKSQGAIPDNNCATCQWWHRGNGISHNHCDNHHPYNDGGDGRANGHGSIDFKFSNCGFREPSPAGWIQGVSRADGQTLSNKPVAKTQDVREALKHLMAEYGAEVMAKVELGNTELLAELCEQATEELLDKHIQPLIEAAIREHKNALEFARGAIEDAIYSEDGLDGGAGQIVINMITEVLDDKDEYESTFKDGE